MMLASDSPPRPTVPGDATEGRRRLDEATREASRWHTHKRPARKETGK